MRRATAYGLSDARQLTPDAVNGFLRSLACSAVTRANQRRELLTLWRYAFEASITDSRPVRVMRIKPPRQAPRAWSHADLQRLLTAAEADERGVNILRPGVRWCHIMPVWIAIGYDSGLRFTDILMLRKESFANNCVCVVAAKTGKTTVRRLSPYTLEMVRSLLSRSTDGSLFRWCVTRRRMLLHWRKFLNELGMPGSSRWLRRSAATAIEKRTPGSATLFLSHSNPALARLHYIDPTLLDQPDGPEPLR